MTTKASLRARPRTFREIVVETDLRSITRYSQRCRTEVFVQEKNWDRQSQIRWLFFGKSNLHHSPNQASGQWTLKAYLTEGVTDGEHDSAYALQLPLIGVEFHGVDYHVTIASAWIDPADLDSFRVPRPGYNPLKIKGSSKCSGKHCGDAPHRIVPEGHFAGAPSDPELFEAVRGRRVEIRFSTVLPEEND